MTAVLFANTICSILSSDQITECHYNEVPVSVLVKAIRCAQHHNITHCGAHIVSFL